MHRTAIQNRIVCSLCLMLLAGAATAGSNAHAQALRLRPTCPGADGPVPLPYPQPWPTPVPQPQPEAYYLGVQVKTVAVEPASEVETLRANRPGLRVAPGYGERVRGQMVVAVAADSPAYHAGLEVGDVIVDANGTPMDTGRHLSYAVQNSQGRLEMKVLDVRTNQLTWVVALLYTEGEVIETAMPFMQRPASRVARPDQFTPAPPAGGRRAPVRRSL